MSLHNKVEIARLIYCGNHMKSRFFSNVKYTMYLCDLYAVSVAILKNIFLANISCNKIYLSSVLHVLL